MSNSTSSLRELPTLVAAMPKAEIHIHLEGSISPATLLKLAKRHARVESLPGDNIADLRRWFAFTDFPHFVEIYTTISDLLRTPEDFELIAYECGADMAAQNIRYRELTVTPYTHTDHQPKGLGVEDILAGLNAGRQRAKERFGVEMRWVFDVPRNLSFPDPSSGSYDPAPADKTLAYAKKGLDKGVVGFGLGGFERGAPPEPFAHAFSAAKEAGLLSVPHAGETMGAESVRGALHDLQADRIGHGVRAIEDESLLAELIERQIPLEVNITSNICLHVYDSFAAHPFAKLDEMGAFVTVNSDDPPLFNTTLVDEYELLASAFGYSIDDIMRVARRAFSASGLDEGTRTSLLLEFDRWVTENVTDAKLQVETGS